MDPLTQGVLGGLIAQSNARPAELAKAFLVGALAGMAADLDSLIHSSSDSLLAIEYHRHFTHSLFFIPIGALVCALACHLLLPDRWRPDFKKTYFWCLLGYGSHGLLDACTSYGTQLLWPFSDQRFAWDSISIIDPLFTLPLLLLVILAIICKQKRFIFGALGWGVIYISLGFIQHQRAISIGYELAQTRNLSPMRLEAKPSFANLMVWKVICETKDHFYVDAVKPGITTTTILNGENIAKLVIARDMPWLDSNSIQAKDLQRFKWFSNGYIALDKNNSQRIIDIRYSLLPNQINPLWGIELDPDANSRQHAQYFTQRQGSREAMHKLINMIFE